MESVRRYVIIPTRPLPLISTPSYNCCARRIVFCVEKLSDLLASCCKVDVVNGSGAFLLRVPFLTSFTTYPSSASCKTTLSTSSLLPSSFFSSLPIYFAAKDFFSPFTLSCASKVQYSCGIKPLISSSLSQIIRIATDCTRPALKPLFTFAQSTGEIRYPTIRSKHLLACWASTRFISISRAFLSDSFTAFLVISLKVIR